MQTVEANKARHSAEEVRMADKARTLGRRLGVPTLRYLSRHVNKGLIRNFPLISKDARRANDIHGKDVKNIRGSYVKEKQLRNPAPVMIKIPKSLIETCKNVRLFVDAMCVNGISFLHTTSDKIAFRASSCLTSESKESLASLLHDVIKSHRRGGFRVDFIDADGKV